MDNSVYEQKLNEIDKQITKHEECLQVYGDRICGIELVVSRAPYYDESIKDLQEKVNEVMKSDERQSTLLEIVTKNQEKSSQKEWAILLLIIGYIVTQLMGLI